MLLRLIGHNSATAMLKEGLDASSVRARAIAHRVANAATPPDGFAGALADASGEGVDLEAEMVALADEQIRFDATTSLLQKVYAQLRSAVKER